MLIISLALSAFAGYLGGQLMGVKGPWYQNLLLGLLGGIVGTLAFALIGLKVTNSIGELIASVVGACIVIWGYRYLKK